jgi:cell division protein FtsB
VPTDPTAPKEPAKAPEKASPPSPKKGNPALIVVSVLAILFLAGAAVLGYFYYNKVKENSQLAAQNAELSGQKSKMETEATSSASLKLQIDQLNDKVATLEAKIKKAKVYNDTFKYVNYLIETHGGFSGWTNDEFNYGRSIAAKTNDATYLKVVDDAWNQQGGDPLARTLSFFKATASGIENSLK